MSICHELSPASLHDQLTANPGEARRDGHYLRSMVSNDVHGTSGIQT